LAEDWAATQAAAERALRAGSRSAAIREIENFLKELSRVRVLDPASGTGNFLYVALRQMKQLEGEVLKQLQDLGGEDAVAKVSDISVQPDQFLGMEVNRRAVEIAELVLWIGYLQWHLRTRAAPPVEPILGDSDHIIQRDAVLTWDGYPNAQLKRDRLGKPIARRDVQGDFVEVKAYPNPRAPEWPEAEFVVGNPPFIGGKDIRGRLGEGYAEALWKAHKHINPSADYVMYWWDRAAALLTRKGTRLRRFGLVTTNSITQVFQRRVVVRHLKASSPISLLMAIPNHPWTKATRDSSAVRIAMTVVSGGLNEGVLREVVQEEALDTDEPFIQMIDTIGAINADLTIGADITQTKDLLGNQGLCSPGVKLHGDGFIVSGKEAEHLGLGKRPGLERYLREYRHGRDITARPRRVVVIDLFGLSENEVRRDFPEVYQHLLETVRAQRQKTFAKSPTRDAREYLHRWWTFGKPRQELRPALANLDRYIVTVETMKHRVFQFLNGSILPDNMLVAIASNDAFHLGVLSSRIHVTWSLRAGGWLGIGNDPRYSKSRCFDPFPFPEASEATKIEVRTLAEELDETRKCVLTDHQELTLTALYNMLEKLRGGARLTAKEESIKARGRVLILKDLHDRIDSAVFRAYGWEPEITDEQIIARLVSLYAERAAEERRGFIRWLRPEYQLDRFGALAHRADRVQTISVARARKSKRPFPQEPKEQAGEVRHLIRGSSRPLTAREIALSFKQGEQVLSDVQDILKSLYRLGQAQTYDNGRSYISSAA
jgi:hypothetical protein